MKAEEFDQMPIRSGVIPYYIKNDQLWVRVMRPSDPKYGGTDWQLAKGRVDDLDPKAAALKEGHEEVGLNPSNIKTMFKLLYAQRLHVWAAEVINPTDFDEPHYETGAVTWLQLPQQIDQLRTTQQWIFEQFVAAMQQIMPSIVQS
jgi:8-oxo-dGTP pyrophosphatase MutT (NUDIX family)